MTMSLLMLAAGVVLAWCLIGGAFWAGLDPSGKWGQTLDYARILIPYMLFLSAISAIFASFSLVSPCTRE